MNMLKEKIKFILLKPFIQNIMILLPVVLIPIIYSLIILNCNYTNDKKIVAILSSITSTVGSSVGTIYCFNFKKYKQLNFYQIIALTISISCYIICIIYEISSILYMSLNTIFIMTIISFIIMTYLLICGDNEIKRMESKVKNVEEIISDNKKNRNKKINGETIIVTRKEEKL